MKDCMKKHLRKPMMLLSAMLMAMLLLACMQVQAAAVNSYYVYTGDPAGIDAGSPTASADTLAGAFDKCNVSGKTYTIVVASSNESETVMAELTSGATVYLVSGDTNGYPADARTIVFASTQPDNSHAEKERHISVTGGSLILQNITLDGNKNTGGGIYVSGVSSSVTLDRGATIQNCKAYTGGGLYVGSNASATMLDGATITGCVSTNGSSGGGGVYVSSSFEMNGGTISGNTSNNNAGGYSGDGGGVFVFVSGSFTMNDGLISDNEANSSGGGVYAFNGGSVEIKGGTIENNTAVSGGGIYFTGSGTLAMTGGTVTGNSAESSGGGIYLSGGSLTMEDFAQLYGNTATRQAADLLASSGTVTLLEVDTMKGATDIGFNGWFADEYGSRYQATLSPVKVTAPENSTEALYLVAGGVYDLIYDANGGNEDSVPARGSYQLGAGVTIDDGSKVTHADDLRFAGWYTEADGEGDAISGTYTIPKNDTTLYAIWKAIDDDPDDDALTVTYKANGGSGDDVTDEGLSADKYTIKTRAEVKFSRSGYSFSGWNTKADGSGDPYTAGTTIDLTKSLTLYAQWTRSGGSSGGGGSTTYTVTYDANGGTGSKSESSLSSGTTYTVKSQTEAGIERDGYTFTGWNTKADGTGTAYAAGKTLTLSGSVTLYAQWTEKTDDAKPRLNTEDHLAYIIGYTDGTVKPTENISRAETATIFFRLLTETSRNSYWMTTNNYTDVSAENWFNNAVSTMSSAGIVSGYTDGSFGGNRNITRAEFAAIAARFDSTTYSGADKFSDISGHWAAEYINRAAEKGWITGYEDGTFKPDQYITRAEAMTLINRVLGRDNIAAMHADMQTWPDNLSTAWYYEAVQEAINSHEYTRDASTNAETWTAVTTAPDWAALEKSWSTAN